MINHLTRSGWRLMLVMTTLTLWVGLVSAQEEAQAADSANDYGPMLAILLLGVVVILAVGGAINSREKSDGEGS